MLQQLATEKSEVCTNGVTKRLSKLAAHYEVLLERIRTADIGTTDCPVVGVTSCSRLAGVSTVALNIAVTAANTDQSPVLLIHADLKLPPSAITNDDQDSPGLADALTGDVEPMDCVAPSSFENVSILAGSRSRTAQVSRIETRKFETLLDEYKQHFRLILVDLPAPTELNGSARLTSKLDGVVLVLEAERADGRAALRVKQQLTEAGAHLLGVVLNKRKQHLPGWLYRLL